jgi:hypothetical protein
MNAKEKKEQDLLHGAKFATSETVASNKFLDEVQKEWLELQAAKVDRVTPRRER